jgi:hypothetical protein
VTAAQARAVARGVLPNSRIVPGYLRREDSVVAIVPELVPVVHEVFRRRDRGTTIVELQAFLLEHGIERSVAGVASMLRARMYLGEIHFGELHNTCAHEPIITDRACLSACSAAPSRAGAKPNPSGCWRAWECCAAARADREW